jgi:hypothetical protein
VTARTIWFTFVVIGALACRGSATPVVASAPDGTDDADDDPEDADDSLPAAAQVTASSHPRDALLVEAHRELAARTESHYAHHTFVDDAHGVYDFDCSGFVGYALSRVAPSALALVVAATRPRPLAKDFYAFFSAPRAPWTRVDRATDLVPGDVIAWLEPPAKHSRNTGHVMIVARAPVAGTRAGELVVEVIDSSHSGHGRTDERIRDHRNGIGSGPLVLLVDASGHATGYRWSLAAHSTPFTTAIALGRLP